MLVRRATLATSVWRCVVAQHGEMAMAYTHNTPVKWNVEDHLEFHSFQDPICT